MIKLKKEIIIVFEIMVGQKTFIIVEVIFFLYL